MRTLKKSTLALFVVATAMLAVFGLLPTFVSKMSENAVEGPSHLYVHVPINATTTPKQRQSWTKYLMIRNALEGFFNPRVRMVRATTPAESLERCRKDAGKGKECPAITPIRHYSTCALVGNSGILLNSSCGEKIDSNDFVIRFNLGPLQDYSKDVGRNVNMTVMNREIVRKLFPMLRKNKTSEIVNLLRPFNNSILLLAKGSYNTTFLAECKSMENIMRGRGLNFTIALSNFNGTGTDKRLWAGLGGKLKSVPTTGLLLLGEAITFCDHVTMFGFYPFDHDRQNRTIPYHYWRDLTAFPSKNKTKHQFVLEYKLLAGLKKDGIIDYTEDCRVIDETKEVTGNFLEGTKEHTRPHLLRKD